jgi:hypothetical protein
MRALTVIAEVRADHTLTAHLPEDILAGVRTIVVVRDDAQQACRSSASLTFHPHAVGPADPACTYRREDILWRPLTPSARSASKGASLAGAAGW